MDDVEQYALNPALNGKKADGTPIKIMIVDDSLAHRRVLSKLLVAVGYEVIGEAENGMEGLRKYFLLRPDVLTMDVSMPEMEGDAAVAEIIKRDSKAKIIMITSMGHKELVEKCIYLGAKGYMLKPITAKMIPKILETLKTAVGS